MTTIKSYSENSLGYLYRTTLRRQIPFAICAGIIYALLIPLITFLGINSHVNMGLQDYQEIANYYFRQDYFEYGVYLADGHAAAVLVVLMIFAMVVTLVQNGYLHSKKMIDLYHSLPVRRSTLLLGNMLSTMTTVLLPFVGVCAVTMIIELLRFGIYMPSIGWYFAYIGMDIFCAIAAVGVIYLCTTLVAMLVGTVFDTFALTCALGILPISVYGVVVGVWSTLTYGSSLNFDKFLALSPFTAPFQRFIFMSRYSYYNYYDNSMTPTPWGQLGKTMLWLAVFAAFGVGLYFLALHFYKRRKSELAEQAQPGGVLQTVVKCFAGFCGAALFYAIFYGSRSKFTWALAMLCGGVLIGLIVELILSRGAKAIKRNIKWLVGASALCCLVVFGSYFDFTGYETRIPKLSNVASVEINYRGRFESLADTDYYVWTQIKQRDYNRTVLKNPESIAIVADAHQKIVDNRPAKRDSYYYNSSDNMHTYAWTSVEYKLKNGSTFKREYSLVHVDALARLADLEGQSEFIEQNMMLYLLQGAKELEIYADAFTLYNAFGENRSIHTLPREKMDRLLDALRADIKAEPLENILNPSSAALGYLQIEYRRRDEQSNNVSVGSDMIVIDKSYTNTISALRSFDLMESFETPDGIDGIILTPLYNSYDAGRRVSAIMPGRGGPVVSRKSEAEMVSHVLVEDAAAINKLTQLGRNQMLLINNNSVFESGAVTAYYYVGDTYVGAQIILFADLPQSIASEMLKRYASSYYAEEYGYEYDYDYDYEYALTSDQEHAVNTVFMGEITVEEAA